jgi:glucose-6-phosphate isomerase/transaldolase/glucose-6-phosphate isomerase
MGSAYRDPTTALYTLGPHRAVAGDELIRLREIHVVERIWQGDHSVWKPSPDEITNRLGWLSLPENMMGETSALTALAGDIRREGYSHVVLLGMGGSSLGPEMLRQAFGSKPGSPALIVLDSTVPGWVSDVSDRIDPARTLFVVSSKSGTTIEPNVLYGYFRGLVDRSVGRGGAGKNFVAVTDPGTALEELASRDGFRRVFHGNADVGGRYSILSNFGLVPAALIGIDIGGMLDRAARMRDYCMGADIADNPGGALGAAIGRFALEGRDKLTLLASPSITGFGLWVEQLVAESLGKEGGGVVPVAGEAALGPDDYGDDRLFVQVRLEGDDNALIDKAVEGLSRSEQPFIRLDLGDRLDLGAEVFKWEFAVAVAGAVLGVNPFDQPDVQAAKDMTNSVLAEFESSGLLPDAPETMPARDLLSEIRPGDYVAIMAYAHQTPELDAAVGGLRRALMTRFHVATTMGYGPRFLHSTGQLHKGGPPSGVFLQLVEHAHADIDIPGRPYSFGVLASAQALGDIRALRAQGRRVSRLDTRGGCASALEALTGSITAGS